MRAAQVLSFNSRTQQTHDVAHKKQPTTQHDVALILTVSGKGKSFSSWTLKPFRKLDALKTPRPSPP